MKASITVRPTRRPRLAIEERAGRPVRGDDPQAVVDPEDTQRERLDEGVVVASPVGRVGVGRSARSRSARTAATGSPAGSRRARRRWSTGSGDLGCR